MQRESISSGQMRLTATVEPFLPTPPPKITVRLLKSMVMCDRTDMKIGMILRSQFSPLICSELVGADQAAGLWLVADDVR